MAEPTLTASERETLANVLAPFADRIERVGVFGSRATGRARPNSDIDLVIYGDIDAELENRLWTLFEDSNLAVTVDLAAYPLILHPGLKAHIDATVATVFKKRDLEARRPGGPLAGASGGS